MHLLASPHALAPCTVQVLEIPEQLRFDMLMDIWTKLSMRPVAESLPSVLLIWKHWNEKIRDGLWPLENVLRDLEMYEADSQPLFPLQQGSWCPLAEGLFVVDTEVAENVLDALRPQVRPSACAMTSQSTRPEKRRCALGITEHRTSTDCLPLA